MTTLSKAEVLTALFLFSVDCISSRGLKDEKMG